MAITQVITTPPAAPTPGEDPAVFNTKILARLSWDTTNVNELNTFASQANALETAVNADADAAAASALTAVNAPGTSATSTTSMVIGTGAKSCTIQTGKSIVVGMWIAVANTAAPDVNYMIAVVTSHNSSTGALGFTVPAGSAFGSGTFTAWTISLSPPPSGQYLPLTGGVISGNLGIGGSPGADSSFVISKNITGAPTSYGARQIGTIQSDVVSTVYSIISSPATQAAAFTLGSLLHIHASQGLIGAGSAITNQYGFHASSNLIGAANNFGFYSAIPAGTGRWNFYSAGTADNYLAGALGIGISPGGFNGTIALAGSGSPGGGFLEGISSAMTANSSVTNRFDSFLSAPNTSAAAFTLASLQHYRAQQGTIGAGSTVTNQYGFSVDSSLIGATNNFGFRSDIPAGTGRWNFYANGTARNFFAGGVEVAAGVTTQTIGFVHIPAAAGAPTGVPTNPTGNVPLYYDTTNNKLYVYNGAWKATAALT